MAQNQNRGSGGITEHIITADCSLSEDTGAQTVSYQNTGAKNMPQRTEGKKKKQIHTREALKTCGYLNWALTKP